MLILIFRYVAGTCVVSNELHLLLWLLLTVRIATPSENYSRAWRSVCLDAWVWEFCLFVLSFQSDFVPYRAGCWISKWWCAESSPLQKLNTIPLVIACHSSHRWPHCNLSVGDCSFFGWGFSGCVDWVCLPMYFTGASMGNHAHEKFLMFPLTTLVFI